VGVVGSVSVCGQCIPAGPWTDLLLLRLLLLLLLLLLQVHAG
jgi:hypothetical protein